MLLVNILLVLRILSQIIYPEITFLSLSPPTHRPDQLTPLPQSLQRIVAVFGPDWTSELFTQLFDSITCTVKLPLPENSTTCGIKCYLQFCNLINHLPLPISEQTFLFTTHFALQHLSSSTILTYLAVDRNFHLLTNHLTAYTTYLTPRDQQVLCGIKRYESESSPHRNCQLP